MTYIIDLTTNDQIKNNNIGLVYKYFNDNDK